jgi:hypothetical protein
VANGCAAGSDRTTGARLIETDVARTFPSLGLFQRSGVAAESLVDLLRAFAVYRPDIGYVRSQRCWLGELGH